MKVEGPKGTQTAKTSKAGQSKKTGDTSFEKLIDDGGASEASSGVGGSSPISQIDSLLAVQEAGDAMSDEAKNRAQKRGMVILDQLEKIRLGILGGTLSRADLVALSDVVVSHRENIMDPELTGILDEIDLRAQVELAKHDRG